MQIDVADRNNIVSVNGGHAIYAWGLWGFCLIRFWVCKHQTSTKQTRGPCVDFCDEVLCSAAREALLKTKPQKTINTRFWGF